MSPPVISVANLGKRYWLRRPATFQHAIVDFARGLRSSALWALREVSFDVAAGEAVAIVGGNGAGKSTLLKLICGLGRPTTGSVRTNGRVSAMLGLGAGFHPDLTGRENLFVSAIVAGGLRRREVQARYDDIVDFAELHDFIDQPLRTYSSGMQMRLGFSVAIHVEPTVMVIDEVLSVGDAHFRRKCLDRIRKWRTGGKTLLLVSHDPSIIRTFCTRALWLRRGALVASGPADEIAREYSAATRNEKLTIAPAAR